MELYVVKGTCGYFVLCGRDWNVHKSGGEAVCTTIRQKEYMFQFIFVLPQSLLRNCIQALALLPLEPSQNTRHPKLPPQEFIYE